MAQQFCPHCRELVHRSRSYNFGERVIKAFSPHRTYRCSECGWRGWLRAKGNTTDTSGPRAKLVVVTILALLAVTIVALYVVGRLTEVPTP